MIKLISKDEFDKIKDEYCIRYFLTKQLRNAVLDIYIWDEFNNIPGVSYIEIEDNDSFINPIIIDTISNKVLSKEKYEFGLFSLIWDNIDNYKNSRIFNFNKYYTHVNQYELQFRYEVNSNIKLNKFENDLSRLKYTQYEEVISDDYNSILTCITILKSDISKRIIISSNSKERGLFCYKNIKKIINELLNYEKYGNE